MIREVRLKRFKRFDDVTVKIPGHVVLAGPNNTGKTTLLQALAAFDLALRRWRQLGNFNQRNGYQYQTLERLAFSAVALSSFDLLWRERATASRTIEIHVLADGHQRIGMEFLFDSPGQVRVRPTAGSRADDLRSLSLNTTFVPAMSGLLREERRLADREAIDDLLAQNRPGEVLRNLLVVAHQDEQAWLQLTQAIERLFSIQLLPPVSGAVLTCEYRPLDSQTRLDISSAGSGFQQVLMLLTLLNTRPGNLILLDEPDAHLHLILQDAIYSELRSVAAQRDSQLMIATHSEVMIDAADPRELCLMYGTPRLLVDDEEKQRLVRSLSMMTHSDLMLADSARGVLYVDDFTDRDLLREFARVLGHAPALQLLERELMWKSARAPLPDGVEGKTQEHWKLLKLVNPNLRALELLDGDAKNQGDERVTADAQVMQRLRWRYYEIESYLLHPAALLRYAQHVLAGDSATEAAGVVAMRSEILRMLQQAFIDDPHHPQELVASYLVNTKASETTLPALLQSAGIDLPKSRFVEIAARMQPAEVNPEVREKLDRLCSAFGVDPAGT